MRRLLLNNIVVYSLLHRRTGEYFGFTEPEVMALLTDFARAACWTRRPGAGPPPVNFLGLWASL